MAKNTIKLKKYSDVIEEFVAGALLYNSRYVGFLLNASGAVISSWRSSRQCHSYVCT